MHDTFATPQPSTSLPSPRRCRTWTLVIALAFIVRPALAAAPDATIGKNLLANPDFDAGIAGWQGGSTWDPNLDADGNAHSGSLLLSVTDPGGAIGYCTGATQCIPLTPATYQLSGKIFVPPGTYPAAAIAELLVFWDPTANCSTGGALPNAVSQVVHPADTQNTWVSVSTGAARPPEGTHSALVAPIACVYAAGTDTANFDDLVLQAATGSCVPSATTLCIDDLAGDRRFAITASFATAQAGGQAGSGAAIPLASLGVNRGGLMWFFSADNPEMLIKVLNACSLNQDYWVLFAAVTNVGFTVTVTDTITGHQKTYHNPDGQAAAPVLDTSALPCN